MAVRLEPRNVDYRLNVGAVLVDLKQSDVAIVHYKEAEQLDPDDAAIYNNWGGALAAQGRFEEAAQQYRRALSLQPDYEAAPTTSAGSSRVFHKTLDVRIHEIHEEPTTDSSADTDEYHSCCMVLRSAMGSPNCSQSKLPTI